MIEGDGEAEVPVLRDAAFAQELSLKGAVRQTRYNRSKVRVDADAGVLSVWKR